MEIEQFLRDNEPKSRRSILYNHLDEILLLRSRGYSLMQIKDYLKSKGVVISVSLICRFIKKNQENNIPESPVSSELPPANKSVIPNIPPSEQSTNPFSVLNKETKSSQFKFTPHKK